MLAESTIKKTPSGASAWDGLIFFFFKATPKWYRIVGWVVSKIVIVYIASHGPLFLADSCWLDTLASILRIWELLPAPVAHLK